MRQALTLFWSARGPLAAFALGFRLLEAALIAPLAALAARAMSGGDIIDSTALVQYFLTPRGALVLGFVTIAVVVIRLAEQGGLAVVAAGALQGKHVTPLGAARVLLAAAPRLLRLAALIIVAIVLVALPVLIATGWYAAKLLPLHDINFYLARRPPEFMQAAYVIGALVLVATVLGLSLAIRWCVVAQACVLGEKGGLGSLRQSTTLVMGARWRAAGLLVVGLLLLIACGAAGAFIARFVGQILLGLAGGVRSIAAVLGMLLILHAFIAAFMALLGAVTWSCLFTHFYVERARAHTVSAGDAVVERALQGGYAHRTRIAVVALLLLPLTLVGGAVLGAAVGERLGAKRTTLVEAHRGNTTRATENTLRAVREAIADGADAIETDVQLTADDSLVMVHDSDLSRLGGSATRIWELTLADARAVDIGTPKDPAFAGDHVATLDEFLEEAKGKVKVNIELKYYPGSRPGLEAKVLETVRRHGMMGEIGIQSLHYEGLQITRQLDPNVPLGYLLSVNARRPDRLDVEFLSAQIGRVDADFVRRNRRAGYGIHVWTVNDSADGERMLDLGVDGIITDRPDLIRRLIDRRQGVSDEERAMRKVKAYLAE